MMLLVTLLSDLLSGFVGNLIGAIIGGIVAYRIVVIQIKNERKRQNYLDNREKFNSEIRLLWDIYFDIKKDIEVSGLYDSYKKLLEERERTPGTSLDEYLKGLIPNMMINLENFMKLLRGKENEIKDENFIELDLLWLRTGQLLVQFSIIAVDYMRFSNVNQEIIANYQSADRLFREHSKKVQNRKIKPDTK